MKHTAPDGFRTAILWPDRPARGRPAAGYAAGGKRAADIVLSLCLILPALPVFLAALVNRALGGEQVFYTQTRIGRDGRAFRCFKFRTMVADADAALARICAEDPARAAEWARFQKLTDDPRITRFGRFLRRTSLDELPQLLNVLRGEMSLIGPRPFTAEQEALYRAAGGRAYFDLRPGITGPWQVSARHGSEFVARVAYDEAYGRSLSAGHDLAILLRTVGVVLRGAGA